MIVVLALSSIGFLFLAIHPFVTYPLSLLAMTRLANAAPRVSRDDLRPLRFAVCVCAYNEAAVIRQKAENLMALKARHPDLEILVYVDCASDATAEILETYADRLSLHVAKERNGKTHGMNLLVAQATADIIIFTDANVMLELDVVDRLTDYFRDSKIGCVCGNLIYTNGEDSVTAASGSLYWKLEEWIKALEQRTGSVMGADGSLFAIRRALHQAPPDNLIDDMYVSFMILCAGYRIVQAKDVRAYEESVTSRQEEFRRKIRIACQAFNVHRILWQHLRTLDAVSLYKYISHKLLRWFVIYNLAAGVACLLLALVLAGQAPLALALCAVIGTGIAIGANFPLKPFAQLYDVLVAFVGVGIGVYRSILGAQFQTWTPATSIRNQAQ